MTSLDGIMPFPNDFKREVRRLVVIALIVAPIGVLASLAITQSHSSSVPQRTVTTGPSASLPPGMMAPLTPGLTVVNQAETQSGSHTSASVELHTTQTTANQAPVTKLKVNDQPIDVPPEGNTHKVITNDNGMTTVDISNSSTGETNSSSSTSVQVNTSTNTITNTQTDTGP